MEAAYNLPPEEKELTPQQELEEMSLLLQSEISELNKQAQKFLKRIKKKEEVTADEDFDHAQRWKYVKQIQKAHDALYKIIYPKGNKQAVNNEGKPDMTRVTSMKSTVGAIVRDIPANLVQNK